MSPDLIGTVVILVALLIEAGMLAFVGSLVYRMREKTDADHAALYLQGKRVEAVLREMRAELLRG